MTLHAMPVMLGVLAILAIAYRYYSAFLAARVAVLDDSRVTPAHRFQRRPELRPDQPLGALRPSFRGDLGGRAADRPGAGDPVRLPAGPDLAGGRRLPGRRGAGHDGAGRLDPPRRAEPGRAGPRSEIGRPAGLAAAIAILYIVIIALAGLGIVVVKALGGEEVPMKAGTVLVYPERSSIDGIDVRRAARRSTTIPAGTTYRFGDAAEPERWSSTSRSDLAVPARLDAQARSARARASSCPRRPGGWCRAARGARSRSPARFPIALFVGWYMYRLRKGKVVEASLIGAVAVLAATVGGRAGPGLAAGAVLLALARRDGLRPGGLRLRRRRAAGLAAALPARLPVELPQDRHDRPAGRRA